MMSRAGNIDSSCSQLSQSNVKGLLNIPCEISVILSTGQGQGQVTKGHERSPKSKILFRACSTWFMVTFARRIKKSKAICNLTSCKSTTKNGRVNPGSCKVKFWNSFFFKIKYGCFWTSLISEFQKCHFYFCAMYRNASIRSLKKWRHQRLRFLGYMFVKYRHINLKFGMPGI